ncbi:hypothetical protein NEAUS04_1633 [Nematocida ausubeli]|nr:hypothetical protein NEAUS04_1633 [Nematocida ausubeli]
MREYNKGASKELTEYSKKEALSRYSVIWNQLYRILSAEDSIDRVKEKLKGLKDTEIVLSAHTRAEDAEENEKENEKGNDSFIGLGDLTMDSLLTIPSEDIAQEENPPAHGKGASTRVSRDIPEKSSRKRMDKLVVDDSESESHSNETDEEDSEYAISYDELSDECSEVSSRHSEQDNEFRAAHLVIEPPQESAVEDELSEDVIKMRFNPDGVKRVRTNNRFGNMY